MLRSVMHRSIELPIQAAFRRFNKGVIKRSLNQCLLFEAAMKVKTTHDILKAVLSEKCQCTFGVLFRISDVSNY